MNSVPHVPLVDVACQARANHKPVQELQRTSTKNLHMSILHRYLDNFRVRVEWILLLRVVSNGLEYV